MVHQPTPLPQNATLAVNGDVFGVREMRQGNEYSRTERYHLIVTRLSDGQVIARHQLIVKGESFSVTGFKTVGTMKAAYALVLEHAAQQASTLPLTNPVTGVVSVPVRIGGAA